MLLPGTWNARGPACSRLVMRGRPKLIRPYKCVPAESTQLNAITAVLSTAPVGASSPTVMPARLPSARRAAQPLPQKRKRAGTHLRRYIAYNLLLKQTACLPAPLRPPPFTAWRPLAAASILTTGAGALLLSSAHCPSLTPSAQFLPPLTCSGAGAQRNLRGRPTQHKARGAYASRLAALPAAPRRTLFPVYARRASRTALATMQAVLQPPQPRRPTRHLTLALAQHHAAALQHVAPEERRRPRRRGGWRGQGRHTRHNPSPCQKTAQPCRTARRQLRVALLLGRRAPTAMRCSPRPAPKNTVRRRRAVKPYRPDGKQYVNVCRSGQLPAGTTFQQTHERMVHGHRGARLDRQKPYKESQPSGAAAADLGLGPRRLVERPCSAQAGRGRQAVVPAAVTVRNQSTPGRPALGSRGFLGSGATYVQRSQSSMSARAGERASNW